MSNIDLTTDVIIQNETGLNLRTKVNDAWNRIQTGVNSKSDSTHNHSSLYSTLGHIHTADVITCTIDGAPTNVQAVLTSLNNKLSGLNLEAHIQSILHSGVEAGFNIVVIGLILSNALSFGSFIYDYYFDTNPTGTNFLLERSSSSNQIIVPKPDADSILYSGNITYLHLRVKFINNSSTSDYSYSNITVTKYNKDITVSELVAELETSEVFIKAISATLSTKPTFISNLSTETVKNL